MRCADGTKGQERTLAKKFEAVHRNTVASSSTIPTACLHFDFCGFLLSPHTLTWLDGLCMGLARPLSYTIGPSSLFRDDVGILKGGGGMAAAVLLGRQPWIERKVSQGAPLSRSIEQEGAHGTVDE